MQRFFTSTIIAIATAVLLNACSNVPENQNQNQNQKQNAVNSNNLISELPKKNSNITSIFYEPYSYLPKDQSQLELILMKEVTRLKGNAKQAIKIVGYTDDEGSSSYNLALAQQRIDFVAEKLRKMGVNWQQIQRYPVGSEKSHCGEDANCKKLMRRIDLIHLEY